MRTLYDCHFAALGFIVAHAILVEYIPLSTGVFIVEALIGFVSLVTFAYIDFAGYDWRWPLSKRPLNQVGRFD